MQLNKILHPVILFIGMCNIGLSQVDTSKFDPLFLQEVVITDHGEEEKLINPIAISTLPFPADFQLQGAASTLANIPGLFADASVGEVFTKVYARGVSLSAEDDIGWYYMSLQEDGLPLTAVQYNQFSPDFFLRPDVSHSRLEVIKGGKSGVLAPSGPGGIINYITERFPTSYSTHDRITLGVHNTGRPFIRTEGYFGGPIGSSNWSYSSSYLYRMDRGPRNIDYAMNNGGQFKVNLQNRLKKGLLTFRLKWLDDKVNRYTGVAAQNWNNPEPAFDQSFHSTSLLPPTIDDGMLPVFDDDDNDQEPESYDPRNGIKAKEYSAMADLDLQLGEWRLNNKLKYSAKSLNWQTAIGGQPLSLDNFITYFISGDAFPIGNVSFSDVASGQQLATVNNQGAFAVFQGLPPSFNYVNGSLPNDAILGSGTWYKDDELNELMNQLVLSRSFEDVDLTLGTFYARSEAEIFTNASFIYATYEAEPRLLSVELNGDQGPTRFLTDANGLSNYGGLLLESAEFSVSQFAFFADANVLLTEDLLFNGGVRYERIGQSGDRFRSAPAMLPDGGLDNNPLTSYDNGILAPSGADEVDNKFSYLSYSFALEHALNNNFVSFARYSLGHKAPELNYYTNNFSNQDIPEEAPPVQKIRQLEIGIKNKGKDHSLTATAYLSRLSNVGYSNFVFDGDINQIFYTPTQFNSSSTTGLELEWGLVLTEEINLVGSATIQNPKLSTFTLYDANETIDQSDDQTIRFDDNTIPHNPKFMFNAGLTYDKGNWHAGLQLNHIGSRYGNLENAFTLPAYSTFNTDISLALSNNISIGLRIRNLFNSAGLANFFGPNQFGSNSDAASENFIQNNPDASFVVFPIMPRAFYLSFDYSFQK